MCQEAVRRLCNPSESCHVRKVARLLARPLRRKNHSAPGRQAAFGRVAIGRVATGAGALGALAVGAGALGALAIGALAIRALAIKRGRIERLNIVELEVGTLHVRELVVEQEQTPRQELPVPTSWIAYLPGAPKERHESTVPPGSRHRTNPCPHGRDRGGEHPLFAHSRSRLRPQRSPPGSLESRPRPRRGVARALPGGSTLRGRGDPLREDEVGGESRLPGCGGSYGVRLLHVGSLS